MNVNEMVTTSLLELVSQQAPQIKTVAYSLAVTSFRSVTSSVNTSREEINYSHQLGHSALIRHTITYASLRAAVVHFCLTDALGVAERHL